jgi:hypothetical protein
MSDCSPSRGGRNAFRSCTGGARADRWDWRGEANLLDPVVGLVLEVLPGAGTRCNSLVLEDS